MDNCTCSVEMRTDIVRFLNSGACPPAASVKLYCHRPYQPVVDMLLFTANRRRSLVLGVCAQIITAKLAHKYFDGFLEPLFNL